MEVQIIGNPSKRDDVQGLRALAVLGVVFFHINKEWLPGGFIGVDIFFVISGYLISKLIWEQREQGRFSFKAFYAARVRRIVPAYLAMLLLVGLSMVVLLIPSDLGSFGKSFKSAFTFTSNLYFSKGGNYFGTAEHEWPLLHTWSLAIEMQFYLFLPVVLVFLPKRQVIPSLVILASVLMLYSIWRIAQGAQQATYFSLSARAPEFLIGALLALYSAKGQLSRFMNSETAANALGLLGVLLITASFICISSISAFPGWMALPPCLGAALIIASEKSLINRWLSRPWWTVIGALSYSLYLWHWPVLAALRYLHGTYVLPWSALVVFALLTAALAWLSWCYVEQPWRHKRNHQSYWLLLGLIGIILAIFAGGRSINQMIVPPLPEAFTSYHYDGQDCHNKISGDCLRGSDTSSRKVLLIGDSHAGHLNGFADAIGKELDISFTVISASGCVPIEGYKVRRDAECRSLIREIKARLPNFQIVMLAGRWQIHRSAEKMQALDDFLSTTQTQDKQVIILADVPALNIDPLRAHRFEALGFKLHAMQISSTNDEWEQAHTEIASLAARHTNAHFIDLSSLPIFTTAPYDTEGKLMYGDTHHLNVHGSMKYGDAAVNVMAQTLRDCCTP